MELQKGREKPNTSSPEVLQKRLAKLVFTCGSERDFTGCCLGFSSSRLLFPEVFALTHSILGGLPWQIGVVPLLFLPA